MEWGTKRQRGTCEQGERALKIQDFVFLLKTSHCDLSARPRSLCAHVNTSAHNQQPGNTYFLGACLFHPGELGHLELMWNPDQTRPDHTEWVGNRQETRTNSDAWHQTLVAHWKYTITTHFLLFCCTLFEEALKCGVSTSGRCDISLGYLLQSYFKLQQLFAQKSMFAQ